jgi:hypothetical protein
MDLVPGFFDDVAIVRDPSWNVAYWNAPHRPIVRDGEPLDDRRRAVHLLPLQRLRSEKPNVVSKHQSRLAMADVGNGAGLYATASSCSTPGSRRRATGRIFRLLRQRRTHSGGGAPAISTSAIAPAVSAIPFETGRPQSFYAWLNEPIDRRTDIVVTRLWHAIHGASPAMQAAFPTPRAGSALVRQLDGAPRRRAVQRRRRARA